MNKNQGTKASIIVVLMMIIITSGCLIFNSNAAEVNTLPPPISGGDNNTSNTTPDPIVPEEPSTPSEEEPSQDPGDSTGGSSENTGSQGGSSSNNNSGGSTSGNNNGGSSSGSSNRTSSNSNNSNIPSSNANLANLGITPHDFSGFRADTTSYSVTVPADTESVEVYAQAQDSNATISGIGTVNLQEGENTVNVVVTAEDGTTKTYTLTITRETSEENVGNTEVVQGDGLAKLNIQGAKLNPEFQTNVYEYIAKYIGERTSLPIEVEATDENYQVEIVGNEELKEGDNLITILVSNSNGENVATYQVTVQKSLVDEEALAAQEEAERERNQRMVIGIVIAVIVIVAIVAFIIIRRRRNSDFAEEYSGVPFYGMNKKNNSDDYDDYDDYDENEEEIEETPKAFKKRSSFIDEAKYSSNHYDDYEEEKDESEEENEELMSSLEDSSSERARRERVKSKFLDGYTKNIKEREEKSGKSDYSTDVNDDEDLNSRAEIFAARVKRNSKDKRFR